MESDNIDKIFRDQLGKSELYYAAPAEEAKDRIWNSIDKNEKPAFLWPLMISAAAVVIILLMSSTFYLLLKDKNEKVAELELQVAQLKNSAYSIKQQMHEQEKYIALLSERELKSPEVNDISKLPVLAKENPSRLKDTVYITKTIEVLKKEEEDEKRQIVSTILPVELMATNLTTISDKERVLKTEFLFIELKDELEEKIIRKDQSRIKFKFSYPGMSAHQTKPLSINLDL